MKSVRQSLVISFAEKYSRMVLQIGATMILSRLLTPRDIGIMAVGLAFVSLTHVLRDFGVSNYLIQEKELTRDRLRTTFGITLSTSWFMAAAIALSSGVVSSFYNEPALRAVLLILSLNFVMIPLGSLIVTLLQREGNFAALYQINLVSAVAYAAVSVILAWMGWGYLAMAWASVAGNVATVVMSYSKMPGHLRLVPGFAEWRRVTTYGAYSVGATLIASFGGNAPDLLIGRLVGLTETGLFSKATGLNSMFNDNVLAAVGSVATSKFAHSHRAGSDIRADFLNYTAFITAFAWPFFAFAGLMMFYVIRLLFGTQWDAAVPVAQIICVASFIGILASLSWFLLTAIGAMRENLSIQISAQGVRVALVLFGCLAGLKGVAVAIVLATIYGLHVVFTRLDRLIHVSLLDVLRATATSFAITAICSIPPAAVLLIAGEAPDHVFSTLVLCGTATGALWLAAVFALDHPVKTEITYLCGLGFRFALAWWQSLRLVKRRADP